MLEKLIAYLKNLPEEEQKKLEEALQGAERNTEQIEEPVTEQGAGTEAEQGERATTEKTEEATREEQEVENVEEQTSTEGGRTEQTGTGEEEQGGQTQEPTSESGTEATGDTTQELLDTKIELALIKLGIREDRLEAAKRLFKTEIHSIEDLDKLKELVKEFPEWQKQKREQGAGFGANLKENGNSLSEEEKKLKSMGIDPKN